MGAIQCSPYPMGVPCFCYSIRGGVIKIVVKISAECENGDKYESLILHKVLIIKQPQLYKFTVILLTVISKWNDSNIISSIKTLKEF